MESEAERLFTGFMLEKLPESKSLPSEPHLTEGVPPIFQLMAPALNDKVGPDLCSTPVGVKVRGVFQAPLLSAIVILSSAAPVKNCIRLELMLLLIVAFSLDEKWVPVSAYLALSNASATAPAPESTSDGNVTLFFRLLSHPSIVVRQSPHVDSELELGI
jgi:hypothetical protein